MLFQIILTLALFFWFCGLTVELRHEAQAQQDAITDESLDAFEVWHGEFDEPAEVWPEYLIEESATEVSAEDQQWIQDFVSGKYDHEMPDDAITADLYGIHEQPEDADETWNCAATKQVPTRSISVSIAFTREDLEAKTVSMLKGIVYELQAKPGKRRKAELIDYILELQTN
jgi:hypothetical protein